ncbi:hypothetical protein GALMADRAFT_230936 [Galerina marginata CBS 339.88]|uniref:Wax synthase domain-containing protein n=1 Tax=Galerina marginata (strain CBS 339.88) TaxID=685588 RepID=A0A067SD39_GALM3|nr:hypothetical protein GALMADRAFT_230936 [Galerina marginata CBS 339.88]
MSWISDPSTRRPLNWYTFTRECLPPLLLCYVTALLVITPRTFLLRLALLPITLYTAFHCATEVNLSKGYPDEERLVYVNQVLVALMVTLGARALIWTFQLEPYQRLHHYQSNNPFVDALDLLFNLRGVGWSWSSGLKVPLETRNTSSKSAFILDTFRSFLLSYISIDFLLLAIQSFSLPLSTVPNPKNISNTFASPVGGSIFDPSLPLHTRYLRSSLISCLFALFVYHVIHISYLLSSLPALILLSHAPSQWPPLFHSPWSSTSLTELWAFRWHQLFRQLFIATGGAPLFALFGRAPAVLGVFFSSGLLHAFALWGMGRGTDFSRVCGFFIMMGVGILAEHAYRALTGRRVGGVSGWIWVALWLLLWGNRVVDAYLTRGLIGSTYFPHLLRPSTLGLGLAKTWMEIP